jgi:beta-1,4-N-acetylglucosaminyltransferase
VNLFVTVGTTRFDSLVEQVAIDPFFRSNDCVLQVGPGGLHPEGFEVFDYTNRIEEYYKGADVVITHAGAGSIYQILDLRKPMIIVPNMDRLDRHQHDIATFMHTNGYALSVFELTKLSEAVQEAARTTFRLFERDDFFAGEDILSFIDPQRTRFV